MNEPTVGCLIKLCPEDKLDKVKDFIITCLKKRTPQFMDPVAQSFSKNHDRFKQEQLDEIHSEMIQTIKSIPWDQAQNVFTATAESLSKASQENLDDFADICSNWIMSGDANQSKRGLDAISAILNTLSSKKQELLKEQILNQLDALTSRHDQNANRFFESLSNIRDHLNDKEVDRLSYIVTRTLESGKPPVIQLVLTWLPKLKLEHKGSELLKMILERAKQGDDSIKNKCKVTLQNLGEYEKTDEIRKEVNEFFGEEII